MGINNVGILKDDDEPKQPLPKDFYLIFGNPSFPSPEAFHSEAEAIAKAEEVFKDDWASTVSVILHRVVWTKRKS